MGTGGFMKTKLLIAAMLAMTAAVAVQAEGPGKGGGRLTALQSEKGARSDSFAAKLDQIDAIERPLLDLEAQYWAWDIQNLNRTSYEDLSEKSKRWIIKPETRDLLFKKIKEKLAAGKVPALTAGEQAKHDQSKVEIRRILSPGRYDQKAMGSVTLDYCIDLKARYWAKRIQDGETEILGYAKTSWPLSKELRPRMVAAIEAKVKEKLENLTKDELYKMDACTGKIHGN
jgi:hypothetical protein